MSAIESMVSKSIDSGEVKVFLSAIDADATWREESGQIYWTSKVGGLEVIAQSVDRCISTLFTYPDGVDDFSAFRGTLPENLNFDLSRAELVALLGPTEKSGDRHDKWKRAGYAIFVTYKKSGPVRVIGFGPH